MREFDFNILHEQQNTHKESTQTDLKGIVNLEVNLYKGLKYNGLYSYASSHHSAIDWATEESAYVATIRGYNFGEGTEEDIESTSLPYGGVYNETNYEQRTSLIRNNLEYRGTIGDELTLDVMVGQEFRTTVYRGGTLNAYGYMHNRGNIFTIRQKGRIPVIFHGILLNVIFPNVLTYLIMAYFQRCTKIVTC